MSTLLLVQSTPSAEYLRTDVGQAFLAMERACVAEAGIGFSIPKYGGARDKATQNLLHAASLTAAGRKLYGIAPGVTVASDPPGGTHQDGTCVDITGSGNVQNTVGHWMRTLGGGLRFGFHADSIAGDTTHWHYIASGTAGTGSNPLDNSVKDDDMLTRRLVRQDGTPGVYLSINSNTLSPIIDGAHLAGIQGELNNLAALGDPFLAAAGPARVNVIVVPDIRTAGAKVGDSDWDPTPEELKALAEAIALDVKAPDMQPILDAIAAIHLDPQTQVDLTPVIAAVAAAQASINANIDDQPTTFELTPKA